MVNETELYIFCENTEYLQSGNQLSEKEMAAKLGIGLPSLLLLERGIVSNRLGCKVLFNIHKNFGIAPKDIFTPLQSKQN